MSQRQSQNTTAPADKGPMMTPAKANMNKPNDTPPAFSLRNDFNTPIRNKLPVGHLSMQKSAIMSAQLLNISRSKSATPNSVKKMPKGIVHKQMTAYLRDVEQKK